MQKFSLILIIGLLVNTNNSYASHDKSTTEKVGDALFVAIPAVAYGSTLYHHDKEGQKQFYKSFATNAVTSFALKEGIHKQRPNGEDDKSFPSAHTSISFQSASFLHERYGLKYAIPAYIGATYVGYSRVKSDNHDVVDVVTGATIGVLSSKYFTTHYKGNEVTALPVVSKDYMGLQVNYKF